jgi:hypothetical protein
VPHSTPSSSLLRAFRPSLPLFRLLRPMERFVFSLISASEHNLTYLRQYLLRIEQIGLHVAGAPQWYISCAQIRVTGGGGGNPPKVSIPGYVSSTGKLSASVAWLFLLTLLSDPNLVNSIYYPVPTSYRVRFFLMHLFMPYLTTTCV